MNQSGDDGEQLAELLHRCEHRLRRSARTGTSVTGMASVRANEDLDVEEESIGMQPLKNARRRTTRKAFQPALCRVARPNISRTSVLNAVPPRWRR